MPKLQYTLFSEISYDSLRGRVIEILRTEYSDFNHHETLRAKESDAMLALEEERLRGFIQIFDRPVDNKDATPQQKSLGYDAIYVEPEFRNNGVALEMQLNLHDWARTEGYKKIVTEPLAPEVARLIMKTQDAEKKLGINNTYICHINNGITASIEFNSNQP